MVSICFRLAYCLHYCSRKITNNGNGNGKEERQGGKMGGDFVYKFHGHHGVCAICICIVCPNIFSTFFFKEKFGET